MIKRKQLDERINYLEHKVEGQEIKNCILEFRLMNEPLYTKGDKKDGKVCLGFEIKHEYDPDDYFEPDPHVRVWYRYHYVEEDTGEVGYYDGESKHLYTYLYWDGDRFKQPEKKRPKVTVDWVEDQDMRSYEKWEIALIITIILITIGCCFIPLICS